MIFKFTATLTRAATLIVRELPLRERLWTDDKFHFTNAIVNVLIPAFFSCSWSLLNRANSGRISSEVEVCSYPIEHCSHETRTMASLFNTVTALCLNFT